MKDNILQKSIYAIFFLSFSLLIFSAFDRYQTTKSEVILVHKKNQDLLTDNLVLNQKGLLEENILNIKRTFNIDNIVIDQQPPQKGLFSISKKIYGKFFIKYHFLKKYLKTIAPLYVFSIFVILIFFFSSRAQKEINKRLTIAKVAEARSELADLVYHDIRSPLTQLKNLIQENNDSKNLIYQSFQQIEQVLENLNSFNQEKTTFKEILNFNEVLEETVSFKKKEYLDIENLQINLMIFNIDNDFSISVNKSNFQRTLSNLINNSIEASRKKKNIRIDLLTSIDQGDLNITITDNGTGLKIENPFSRSNSSKSQSGLGLHQSKKFVESLKGSIEIQSREDESKGAKVKITLPLKNIKFAPSGVILIDDSEVVHRSWELISKSKNLPYQGFRSLESFFLIASKTHKTHTVFVDYHLKKTQLDISQIHKILSLGFSKIVINSNSPKARNLAGKNIQLLRSKVLYL